jgi:tRNA pseudouridine55 synthase
VSVLSSHAVCAFIYKPAGITSHDVLAQLRKAFPSLKTGHGGTLDPFATGVLPVFFGNWTRLSSLFSFADKRYKAQIELGTATDTGDWTGTVIKKKTIPLFSDLQLNMLQRQLHGEIDLHIPIYSALKLDGKPMYELARKGELTQSIRSRKTKLYHVTLQSGPLGHQLLLDVTCSHGTYIRSLGEYIAQKLQTVGHLSSLERVSYSNSSQRVPFPAISLEDFKMNPERGIITLQQLDQVLPAYDLSAPNLRDLHLGRQKYLPFRLDGWRIAKYDRHVVAVIYTENGKITQRIFMPIPLFSPEIKKAVKKVLPRLSYFDC